MRFLRLATGIVAIWQGISEKDWPVGLAGTFLILLAIVNVGCCCSATTCSIPSRNEVARPNGKEELKHMGE